MADEAELDQLAAALQDGIGLLVRRLRQVRGEGELTMAESSALSRLSREGPTTSSALARAEQITAQSMGATLGSLEARGLVRRRPDPRDGRRVVLSVTEAGREVVLHRRNAVTEQLTRALSSGFSPAEHELLGAAAPLVERLARSV
jgi:DNA-binding MarR family transcriptional regulator